MHSWAKTSNPAAVVRRGWISLPSPIRKSTPSCRLYSANEYKEEYPDYFANIKLFRNHLLQVLKDYM